MRQLIRLCTSNKSKRLTFTALDSLPPIVLFPEEDHVLISFPSNLGPSKTNQRTQHRAPVPGLLLELANGSFLRSLTVLQMAARHHPQTRILYRRTVVAMLKKRRAIGAQQHYSDDRQDGFFWRGDHEKERNYSSRLYCCQSQIN